MSRTFKDKPSKLRYDPYDMDRDEIVYNSELYYGFITSYRLQLPTTKTKKRKEVDTEYHWMSTPSWWTKMCMLKPQRRKGRLWEVEVVKLQIDALEEADAPGVSRKPHIYYH